MNAATVAACQHSRASSLSRPFPARSAACFIEWRRLLPPLVGWPSEAADAYRISAVDAAAARRSPCRTSSQPSPALSPQQPSPTRFVGWTRRLPPLSKAAGARRVSGAAAGCWRTSSKRGYCRRAACRGLCCTSIVATVPCPTCLLRWRPLLATWPLCSALAFLLPDCNCSELFRCLLCHRGMGRAVYLKRP